MRLSWLDNIYAGATPMFFTAQLKTRHQQRKWMVMGVAIDHH
jgi:hypothetical protein